MLPAPETDRFFANLAWGSDSLVDGMCTSVGSSSYLEIIQPLVKVMTSRNMTMTDEHSSPLCLDSARKSLHILPLKLLPPLGYLKLSYEIWKDLQVILWSKGCRKDTR